jgi:hypothetical protein
MSRPEIAGDSQSVSRGARCSGHGTPFRVHRGQLIPAQRGIDSSMSMRGHTLPASRKLPQGHLATARRTSPPITIIRDRFLARQVVDLDRRRTGGYRTASSGMSDLKQSACRGATRRRRSMSRMRWLPLVGGLLLASSGCCWWADKMCPQSHYAPPAYYPAPQCCQPCVPYTPAPQGTAGYPTGGWTPPPPPPCPCTPH